MRNIFENIVILLVIVFSIMIVVLIVQYNHIDEQDDRDFNISQRVNQGFSTNAYLEKMERYRDVDTQVNPYKENHTNRVKVQAENVVDELGNILKNTQEDTIGNALDNL